MRTIKFRGKRVDNGEWVFGSLDLTDNQAVILWDRTDSEGDTTPSYTFVDPETVGQFTGLLDENEKEIYEGDIVNESEIRYEICWYADIAAFMAEDVESYRPFLMSDMDLSETTVVGNIHDNPQKINQEIALPFTPSTPCYTTDEQPQPVDNFDKLGNPEQLHTTSDREMMRFEAAKVAMQGLFSNPNPKMVDMPFDDVAQCPVRLDDLLITKLNR